MENCIELARNLGIKIIYRSIETNIFTSNFNFFKLHCIYNVNR